MNKLENLHGGKQQNVYLNFHNISGVSKASGDTLTFG